MVCRGLLARHRLLFIINPVGSMIQPNRQDKYSFDTDSLASVFLLTRSRRCPAVPSGQPDGRRRVPSHVTWHVHNLQTSPAQRPNPDHRTNDSRSTAASVYRLHSRPRPHCSSATLPRFALQLDAPVVVLRNAAAVPSSQLPAKQSGERVHCSLRFAARPSLFIG